MAGEVEDSKPLTISVRISRIVSTRLPPLQIHLQFFIYLIRYPNPS